MRSGKGATNFAPTDQEVVSEGLHLKNLSIGAAACAQRGKTGRGPAPVFISARSPHAHRFLVAANRASATTIAAWDCPLVTDGTGAGRYPITRAAANLRWRWLVSATSSSLL